MTRQADLTTQQLFIACMSHAVTGEKTPDWKACAKHWKSIFGLAQEQHVEALLYDAIQDCPQDCLPPRQAVMVLYTKTMAIEKQNEKINKVLCELFTAYTNVGARPMLVKGQSLGLLYPNPAHRSPGDIDVFLPEGFDAAHQWMLDNGQNFLLLPGEKKHVHFDWQGIPIENHFKLAVIYNKTLNNRLQTIFSEALSAHAGKAPSTVTINGQAIETLPPTFALLHLLIHFTVHLVSWGVGIRQFHDILLFFRHRGTEVDKDLLNKWIADLKLGRITTAIAKAAIKEYGLREAEIPYSLETGKSREDAIFRIMLSRGNFGHNGKTKRETSIGELARNTKLYISQCRETYGFYPEEIRSAICGKFNVAFKRLRLFAMGRKE